MLYEGEDEDAIFEAYVGGEAANGSVAQLVCLSPASVLAPGGSLFADSEVVGGGLIYKGPSHSGVFRYDKAGQIQYIYTFQYTTSEQSLPEVGARLMKFDSDGWPVLLDDLGKNWGACGVPEATYDHRAPDEYHDSEVYNRPGLRQAHYGSSSSTLSHCTYHSARGSHCVGKSLRATHPQLGSAGPAGLESSLHGRIDEVGSAAWWREQEDHCNPLVETQLGKPLQCTRFEGLGDVDPAGHVSTMERIRGCKPLACTWTPRCKRDDRSRALKATLDECTDGFACKQLPQRAVVFWDVADFFDGGTAFYNSRDGLAKANASTLGECTEAPRISSIDPAAGQLDGGTLVTIFGTGFGSPARCRFGWLETIADNVTANEIKCTAPALDETVSLVHLGLEAFGVDILLRQPVPLEVSDATDVEGEAQVISLQ